MRSQFAMLTQSNADANKTRISTSTSTGEVVNPAVKERIGENLSQEINWQASIVDYTKSENLPEPIPKSILGDIIEKTYSTEDHKKFKHTVRYVNMRCFTILQDRLSSNCSNYGRLLFRSSISARDILYRSRHVIGYYILFYFIVTPFVSL